MPRIETRGPAASTLRDSIFRVALLCGDAVAVLASFVTLLALGARPAELLWFCLAEVPLVVVGAKLLGLYHRDEALIRKTTLEEAPRLFQLATTCVLLAWVVAGPVGVHLGRGQAVLLWLLLTPMLMIARCLARMLALRVAPRERCLFVGDREGADTVRGKLEDGCGSRSLLVAYVDLAEIGRWSAEDRSTSKLEEVRELVRKLDVHRAIVAPLSAGGVEVLDLVRTLKAVGVRVSVRPRLLEVIGSSVEFDDLYGVTVMGVRRFELTRSSAAVKRWFDVAFAGAALLVASPALLLAAIAIRLDSPGGVIFRQQRVGRHGRRFQIFKLRTMVADAEELKDPLREGSEALGMFKLPDDPRVTRVGRLLRTTALDELPQLLNVLKGEMSIVGPRPERTYFVEQIVPHVPFYGERHAVKPGITGWAQINHPYGASLHDARHKLSYDLFYVKNHSLLLDLIILIQTVRVILFSQGAR